MMPKINDTVGRRLSIFKQIEEMGQVNVHVLSKMFNVSKVTIRNDLKQLENKNLLIRTHGGAIKQQVVGIDFKMSEKTKQHPTEKQKIGKKAAELVNDGETIILDSGTTTIEIAKNLNSFKDLKVITNALNISFKLVEKKNIKVIIPGGFFRENTYSLVGPIAESSIRNFLCDKAFLGSDGFDSHYGISTPNIEEAYLNRAMIEIAKEVIIVADSSKFGRRRFAFIAGIDKIDVVVTDANILEKDRKNLENAGVQVIIVD